MRSKQGWRVPTAAERAIIDKLLRGDFPGSNEARAQASDCLVRGSCACGCPSIEFKIEARHAALPNGDESGNKKDDTALRKLDVEGGARKTSESPGFLILLFERNGRLAELEFAPLEDGQFRVPPAEDIEVYLEV